MVIPTITKTSSRRLLSLKRFSDLVSSSLLFNFAPVSTFAISKMMRYFFVFLQLKLAQKQKITPVIGVISVRLLDS